MKTLLAVLLFASSAMAQNVGPRNIFAKAAGGAALINGATMAAPRSFTTTVPQLEGMGLLTVFIELTDANTSITNLSMVCTAMRSGSTTVYKPQSVEVAAGVGTSYDVSWNKATPGTSKWIWRVDVESFAGATCTFTPTAGGEAGDLLTVYGIFAVKQG